MDRRVVPQRGSVWLFAIALAVAVPVGLAAAGSPAQSAAQVRRPPTGYAPGPTTRESELGRALYQRLKCSQCHAIGGRGGNAGPPLDGIGGRRGDAVITMQLSDPARFAEKHPDMHRWEPTYMPHPRLSSRQVQLLVAYLMTLPEPAGGFASGLHATTLEEDGSAVAGGAYVPTARSELSDRGERLFFKSGCATCHAIGRYGGDFAPRLDGIGGRHSREYIVAHVTNPKLHALQEPNELDRRSLMPQSELPPDAVQAIVEFLLTVPDLGDAGE